MSSSASTQVATGRNAMASLMASIQRLLPSFPVSYTHLTLPTNREV